jgi:glycosyltransferase involved in cell wall biosynthesis
MIHDDKRVREVFDLKSNEPVNFSHAPIIQVMYALAADNAERFIVWCHINCKNNLNRVFITSIKFPASMLSYGAHSYFPDQIGYVEQTPFANPATDVFYPTWMMSSTVGLIHSKQLLKFEGIADDVDFNYALNSIAKLGMPRGLLCSSEPSLLTSGHSVVQLKSKKAKLFRFVKQHYSLPWVFLLFLNYSLYERKWLFFSLVQALFYKRRFFRYSIDEFCETHNNEGLNTTIDVVIPTIGRSAYLYNVLKDLAAQTLMPQTVILVEQHPDINSSSALDYLETESWPFRIKHHFIHTLGACQARNIALDEVTSDYVFFADDDIRLGPEILKTAIDTMHLYEIEAATLSCLQDGEIEPIQQVIQWHTFGSGCGIVKGELVKDLRFNNAFEFGFGEDADYGMQLRKSGADILYFPHCKLQHLKAPIGGFRTKVNFPWENDSILPKPSPTVMLFNLKHLNTKQLLGYKTTLFIKFFKARPQFNILGYLKSMRHRWSRSVYWAQQLQQAHDND